MQVLCIETQSGGSGSIVEKGGIYTSYRCKPDGNIYRGVDMWHKLEEIDPKDIAHASLFVDLPSEEGQSFKKEETVEIPQKLQPFYKQL
jgi:hypothetical protein